MCFCAVLARLSVATLAATLVFPAAAQVNKCMRADGQIEFSDVPCASTSKGGQVSVRSNSLDSSGAREQSLKAENNELRQRLSEQQRGFQTPPSQSGRTYPDLQSEKAGSYACKTAQRNYETANSRLTDKRDTRPERLRMYAECGMKEPDEINVYTGTRNGPRESITNCNNSGCFGSLGSFYPASTCQSSGCNGPNGFVTR